MAAPMERLAACQVVAPAEEQLQGEARQAAHRQVLRPAVPRGVLQKEVEQQAVLQKAVVQKAVVQKVALRLLGAVMRFRLPVPAGLAVAALGRTSAACGTRAQMP